MAKGERGRNKIIAPPKLAIGPVEAVFIERLSAILTSVKVQLAYEFSSEIEDAFNRITATIFSEQFNVLVAKITAASSESDFSFKGYTYPDLEPSYVVEKWTRYKYQDAAPFKNERFAKNRRASLVGVMEALSKNRDAGEQILQAFGQYYPNYYSETNEDFTSLILDPAERRAFQEKARKKRSELASKRNRKGP